MLRENVAGLLSNSRGSLHRADSTQDLSQRPLPASSSGELLCLGAVPCVFPLWLGSQGALLLCERDRVYGAVDGRRVWE